MEGSAALGALFALQLFIIVDPVAGVPFFLAITPGNTMEERRAMARRGCLAAFGVLVFFLLGGPPLLRYFGIQTASVRIAGGLLLFVIALEMLYGRTTGTGSSRREAELAEVKEDVSITPLAIPLLAGPGAIATCLVFADRVASLADRAALLAGAAAVMAATFLLLRHADALARALGSLGTTIVARLMGLLLAFLSVQYVVDGLRVVLHLSPAM